MASQITNLMIVYSAVYSGADQRKHQSSASLAFVRRIHRWPVNSPHKRTVTQEMFPFDDVIMTMFHTQVQGESRCCCLDKTPFHTQVQTEFRHFCEKTSVKGVKRTVDKTRVWARVLWTVVVLACLFLSIGNTAILTVSYLKRTPAMYIKEGLMTPQIDKDQNSIPAVTVCNVHPLSKRKSDDVISFSQYVSYIERTIDDVPNITESSKSILDRHKSEIISPIGYYQFLGTENASKIGHSFNEFVVVCEVMMVQATKTYFRPCAGLVNITLDRDPNFFNCYTIQPADQTALDLVMGYSLVLYVDADYSWVESAYTTNPMKYGKGAIFDMHQPNAKPSVKIGGTSVSPGAMTLSKVSMQKHKRLTEPYGSCLEGQQSRFFLSNGVPMRYTTLSCFNTCVRDMVAQECNCRDGTLPVMIWHDITDLPFCGDAHAHLDLLLQRISCANHVRQAGTDSCHQSCHSPCREASYDTINSHVEWPDSSDVGYLYDTYIRGSPVEKLFGTIHELTGGECDNLNESCIHMDYIAEKIKSNFAVIRPHIFDHQYMTLGSDPSTTLVGFVSQIGGAINLWLGISLVVIVELLEIVWRLVFPTATATVITDARRQE